MATSFQQNIRFRNVPEERIDEFDFVGGLVTDRHETKLQSNQSPELYNTVYNDTGSIKTRNGYLRYNNEPAGSSSDESTSGPSTGFIILSEPEDYVAQTFQVGANATFVQCNFTLEIASSGQTQLVRAELWSTSSGAPSALLQAGQILLNDSETEEEYTFRFRLPYDLTASTTYAVVLRPFIQGDETTINTVLVGHVGNTYANGSVYTSNDSGASWTADATKDLIFNVYTGGATGSTGLIRFYGASGVERLINKIGSTYYVGNDNTGAMTAATLTGMSVDSTGFVDWTIANDTLLVVDRTNFIKKYRGSTNSNYTTGTISVTNGSATVTGSGTSWNTTTNAEAGEYIKLPDGKWYRITLITNNTTLTIECDYQGSTVSGQSYTISPWGEIQGKLETATTPVNLVRPTPTSIANHINRIWTLDGNQLRFSVLDTSIDEDHFNDWDTGNNAGAINIPSGNGDSGTGLYSLNNALYVFQRRAIWRVYGDSPANFELRNVSNEIGMIDKRTLVEWNDILIFLADQGIYMFDGSNLRNISDGVVNNLINSWASKTTPVATLWNNTYLIAYTPAGGSSNSEMLFYDLTRQAYGKVKDVYCGAFSIWGGGSDNGEIYFASSNQGSVYRWDIGGNDDGYEIETVYDTPSLGFGAGINDKAIKKFYLQQLALGDWSMTVDCTLDVTGDNFSSNISLSTASSVLWDVASWDVATWPDLGTITTERVAEFQGIAKYYKFRFYQLGYNQGIEILAMTVTGRLRRLR